MEKYGTVTKTLNITDFIFENYITAKWVCNYSKLKEQPYEQKQR